MKILFLTNNPNLGSTARILQSWLLMATRHDLTGQVVVKQRGDFSRWLADKGVPYQVDPMPWPSRRWPFSALWHAWKLARWARQSNVDVIHCNEHDVYPFGLLLRRLLRRPLVCHVRFRITREFCAWTFGKGRQPDALFWTSQQQRQDCASAVEGIVSSDVQHLVPLGIDLDSFGLLTAGREATRRQWGFRPDQIVIGTASALRPHKRIEDFIEIVTRLARQDPRVVGVLAGDTMPGAEDYRTELLTRIKDTGLGSRLIWVGNLEPVEPFYHAVDVFVSTSEYETFGNSVCEAMACSRPVAAYAGGSVQEVVGEAGLIVSTGDLGALTNQVATLTQRVELRVELGTQGRHRVAARFNPANSLLAARQVYRTLSLAH
jgi:L-malate glycosyltransferase